jgi:hypothetical protein
MSPGPSISIYFPHVNWEKHSSNYSVDIRGDYQDLRLSRLPLSQSDNDLWGHLWRFDVAKNFSNGTAGDEVVIECDGIEGVPAGAAVYLIDRELERMVDLRDERRYSFFMGEKGYVTEEEARFALIVGSEDFLEEQQEELPGAPRATVLYQNYPNPFNPETIIRYELAKAGHISISIYDINGSLVRILYQGHREPGMYEVGWNGENERGIRIASGIYFYRLRAGDFSQTRKMVFMR